MSEGAITVTLKSGKGYEAHWVVFRGNDVEEVRRNVSDYFDLDLSEDLALNEVVQTAEQVLHAGANLGAALGAKPVKAEKPAAKKAAAKPKAEPEPQEDPVEALIAEMRAAVDTTKLRRIGVENKELLKDERARDAYKSIREELKAKEEST